MSTTVDNRVVEMEFDNAQFEKGVQQTLGSLDQLKQSLDFENSSLSGIGNDLNTITSRFSNLGVIGTTVLADLTSQALRFAERTVSALSIDQVTAGWEKYADKTTAVQTIMSATRDQFEDEGKQMEYVNEQLDKLNWYTDETSYNFVDMVGNIGKFTAAGVGLDDAVTAMMGIANWAAVSGQNAGTASRAMYQLSQAMGSGVIKLMDWRSIQNANMATVEFKNTVLETAAELGTLEKAADGTYKTLNDNMVDTINFAEHLTDDEWFTSAVLIKALDKYGAFTNEVYKLSQAEENADKTTSELLEELKNGGKIVDEFGYNALRSAQEAKTFAEALDSVKDAASTAWMQSFELIFGDYKSAKKLWTDLSNYLWNVFVGPIANVNELLKEWVGEGGREAFLEALESIGPAINRILEPLKKAWDNVFEAPDASGLVRFSENLRDFIQNIKFTDEQAKALQITFEAFFTVLKTVLDIFKSGLNVIKTGLGFVLTIVDKIFTWVSKGIIWINDVVERVQEVIKNSETLAEIGERFRMIGGGIVLAFNAVKTAIDDFLTKTGLIEKIKKPISDAFQWIADTIVNSIDFLINWPKELKDSFENFLSSLFDVEVHIPTLTEIIQGLAFVANEAGKWFDKAADKIIEWYKELTPVVNQFLPNFVKTIKTIFREGKKVISYFLAGLAMIGGALKTTLEIIKIGVNTAIDFITDFFSAITGADYGTLTEALKGMFGSAFDVVFEFYRSIANVIKDVFSMIAGTDEEATFWQSLKVLFEKIKNDLEPLSESLKLVGENIRLFFDGIFGIDTTPGEKIIRFFDLLSAAVRNLFDVFINIGIGLVRTIKTVFTKLYDFVGQPTLYQVVEMFKMVAEALLAFSLADTLKSVKKTVDELTNIFGGLSKMVAAKNVKSIADGVLELSFAVLILSIIPRDQLENGLLALSVISVWIGLLGKLINGLNNLPKINGTGGSAAILVLSLAASVTILASAVKKLDGVKDLDSVVGKVLAMLIAVMLAMIALTKINLESRQIKTVIGYVLTIAAMIEGVERLIKSVVSLSNAAGDNPNKLIVPIAGVVAILGMLTLLLVAVNRLVTKTSATAAKTEKIKAIAIVIGSLGSALLLIAAAAKIISTIPTDALIRAGIAIGAVMAALGIFIGVLGAFKNEGLSKITGVGDDFKKISKSFITFAVALIALAGAFALFGLMPDWSGIWKGLAVIGILTATMLGLAAIVAFAPGIGKALGIISVAIKGFGLGLLAAVTAILLFIGAADLILASVGVISAAFTGILAALTAAITAALPMIMDLVSIFVVDFCNTIIGTSDTIISAIVTFIGIIGSRSAELGYKLGLVVAGIVYGIAEALPAIIDAALYCIIMLINGLAEALRGNSGALWDSILNLVSSLIELVVSGIGEILNMFGIPTGWVDKWNSKIEGFFKGSDFKEPVAKYKDEIKNEFDGISSDSNIKDSIGKAASGIGETMNSELGSIDSSEGGKNLTSGLATYFNSDQAISDSGIDSFGGGILSSLSGTLTNSETGAPKSGFDFVSGFANSLTDNSGIATLATQNLGADSLGGFNKILGSRFPSTETAESGKNFILGFANGIDANTNTAKQSVTDLAKKCVEVLNSFKSKFAQIGKDCAQGFANGLRQNVKVVTAAGTYIGDAAIKSAKKTVDSDSPSKKFMQLGLDSDKGFAIGLTNNAGIIEKAGAKVGGFAFSALKEALEDIPSLWSDSLEISPVITPILDLQNIQNGSNLLSHMLDMSPRTSMMYDAMGNPTTYGAMTNVNITVYGAEGQDVNELADVISQKIDRSVSRRASVWA